ncbi:hypothetical protein ABIA33_002364 [Streptacidiphilus sp. MAP12-16]|uniref:hypothetical protein n=1 Tax=Streptacidiphilus sp. MAP12-16 TaxID=3156300 RepID=UPI003516EB09
MNPATTTGTRNYTICYGALDSPHIPQVFVEMRAPDRAKMAESALGAIRRNCVATFHFTANPDDEVGGWGSRRSVSAFGAASEVGQRKFIEYRGTHFDFASQSYPLTDGPFSDASFLLSEAGQVAGLRSAEFD